MSSRTVGFLTIERGSCKTSAVRGALQKQPAATAAAAAAAAAAEAACTVVS